MRIKGLSLTQKSDIFVFSVFQLVIKLGSDLLKQPTSSPGLSGRQLEVGGGHLGPADLAIAPLLSGTTNTTIDPSLGHFFSPGDR